MYCETNFKTKKELKEAIKSGQRLGVFQPGGIFTGPKNGRVCLEGPHYPQPHKWYASVEIQDNLIVKFIS